MDKPKGIKLGISACLLGQNVRYDGGNRLDMVISEALDGYVDWVPVCPEVECGLPVPREVMRLMGNPGNGRLVTVYTGIDHTEKIRAWLPEKLLELEKAGLKGFIFKDRSPSCGLRDVACFSVSGEIFGTGPGIFASEFLKRLPLLPVEGEGRLHDPALMRKFIARIIFHRIG